MKLNLLKLNDDKASRPSTSQYLHTSIKVEDQYISPSDEPPKNLGNILILHADSEIMLRINAIL